MLRRRRADMPVAHKSAAGAQYSGAVKARVWHKTCCLWETSISAWRTEPVEFACMFDRERVCVFGQPRAWQLQPTEDFIPGENS